MSFLNPWVALGIAAVVIPALLILYFLKLRRREEIVPSTLLWRRAVQDLQVNAPFQRLRKSLLLLLQLLVLGAALVALARPIVESEHADARSLILIIDRSASMSTVEAGGQTRLDLAKEQAVRLLSTLNRRSSSWFSFRGPEELTRVMVIAFADRATIVAPFTTSTGALPALVREIQPTHAATNLREALELAEAHMLLTRGDMRPNVDEAASRIVLYSDGAIADARDLVLRQGSIELVRIGETRDNVGVTALRVQRSYERPEQLSVFAQVQNAGPAPVQTDLTLHVGDAPESMRLAGVQPLALEAAAEPAADEPNAPAARGGPAGNVASVSFELVLERGAVLRARLARGDALDADDQAFAIVPPPRRMSVLLVSERNFFWEAVLRGLPLERWTYLTPAQYEAAAADDLTYAGRSRFDVVVLDKHDTARLPPGNYLFVACAPRVDSVRRVGELAGHAVMWWDENHPVLRHVAIEQVIAGRGLELGLPREAETIAEGPRGPMIARWVDAGRQFMVITFAVEASNWWQKEGFPIFVHNTIRFLGSGGVLVDARTVRPGQSVRIQVPPGVLSATVTGPDGGRETLVPDADGTALFGGTRLAGVYSVSPAVEGQERFAVNMEDGFESDVTPRGVTLGAAPVREGSAIQTATPEIWRYFVLAALVVALFEWYVYNRRVML